MEKFDFSGWATKVNIKCSDGRTIMKDAFKHHDGKIVPLIWNHKHDEVSDVLGHALLESRDEGIYAYGKFNDTENGRLAKLLVQHGDVDRLSIYANQLKQQGPYVTHGQIRELSLVLAGANPGAFIENVVMAHGDDRYELEDEVRIFTDQCISLYHSDDVDDNDEDEDEEEIEIEVEKEETKNKTKEKGESDMEVKNKSVEDEKIEHSDKKETADTGDETLKQIFDTLNEKQKEAVYTMIGMALEKENEGKDVKHSAAEQSSEESDETISDILNTFNEKQKKVLYALIGKAVEDAKNEGGNNNMKHNLFDQDEMMEENVLSHSEMGEIFEDAKRYGSLKESFLAHGIENIDVMFPEAQLVGDQPALLAREDSWVSDVLNTVHKTPFARIKTVYADITADEARAKGYVKGKQKVEEVIKAFKRTTVPTTIYKKQKLDRDDIVDIDMDIVAWLKSEMKRMLNEEVARAILIGDGREADDADKINEENIRPIWTDEDVYTIKEAIDVTDGMTSDQKAKAFIRSAVKSRKNYKGSGNPTMFMSEDMLTDCLLLEDTNGRVIYDTMEKLANALRVKKIVAVRVMENITRTVDTKTHTLAGIYVNLSDYNVGANKGGAVNMFDDFDIDYNQMKYLMETRCSGALTRPHAAVAIEMVTTAGAAG